LAKLVKKSRIMKNFPVTVIPYAIDHKIYYKQRINYFKINNIKLQKSKKYIDVLFISAGKLFNFRKGFDLLDNAISQNLNKKKYRLILVGKFSYKDLKKIKSNFITIGEIIDENIKSKLYNFVDLLALPSRLDNLPNVGLEAHSCGTPIVAYKVGGVPEIVNHKKTGYLADPLSYEDFICGIDYVYKNRYELQKNALKKSKIWSQKIISAKYQMLFKNI